VTRALLTAGEQRQLLTIAREALVARVSGFPPPVDASGPRIITGAFVTIHHRGDLRGCLGRVEVAAPLVDTVGALAAAAADSDPRFAPVRPDELDGIAIEISVLSTPVPLDAIEQVVVGRHGLMVERGSRRGLLLPQVATEHGWDAATFAAHTCLKAGLSADAWQHGARLLMFEAQVFGEAAASGGGEGSGCTTEKRG
jgi:AmmeMemoRadiSam system protein A